MSRNFVHNIDFYAFSEDWLSDRMLFIAGPRQVGKTTYAKQKIQEYNGIYLDWDDIKVRKAYLQDSSFFTSLTEPGALIAIDEIHKRRKWKDTLKGIYDVYRESYKFIITGSARLDTFRRSGDSLVGRYFLTHIFPLSIGDLINLDFKEFKDSQVLIDEIRSQACFKSNHEELKMLLSLGGFPEPFFKGSHSFWKRWQNQHQELLIREDMQDLSNIQSLDKVENLVDLLKPRVARTSSYNSLAEDLEVSHSSIKQWLLQLENIMLTYRLKPWSKKINRSFKKNPKIYFYDWSFVQDEGARFENFVASQLLKAITLWNDRFGSKFDLYFIRTYDDQEVDFCITESNKPWLLIEAKKGKPEISSAIMRFKNDLKVPAIVLSNQSNWNIEKDGIYFIDALRFFSMLP